MGVLPVREEAARERDLLESCVSRVVAELHRRLPDYGRDVAIVASDLPAYATWGAHKATGLQMGTRREQADCIAAKAQSLYTNLVAQGS